MPLCAIWIGRRTTRSFMRTEPSGASCRIMCCARWRASRIIDMRGLQPDGTVVPRPRPWRLSEAACPLSDPERTPCRLVFCTPLSLQRQGKLIECPTLKDVVVRAGWRIEAFLPPSQRTAWREARSGAIELAANIRAEHWQGQRLDLQRYSGRQEREFCVQGVCGWLSLPEGPGPLWPLLAALQWLHVGKSTIVGLGQLQIEGER